VSGKGATVSGKGGRGVRGVGRTSTHMASVAVLLRV